jgi:hypothetical protein
MPLSWYVSYYHSTDLVYINSDHSNSKFSLFIYTLHNHICFVSQNVHTRDGLHNFAVFAQRTRN